MIRSLCFMLVASPMLILGQTQTVPLTIGNYITTLLIPRPSEEPVTVVIAPTPSVVPAAVSGVPPSASIQPATAVTNLGPAGSFSSYPGFVSPPPGVVSPPPGVVTSSQPGVVTIAPPAQASGNAESVFLSLLPTISAVSGLPNPSSIVPAVSAAPSQASVNALSVFSSIIAGYTSTPSLPFISGSLFAPATSQLPSATVGSLSDVASAFTTVTISSIISIPSVTGLATGTGIVIIPLPNGGSTTVSATGSGPSLTSVIAESILSSTFVLPSTSTENRNTMYPTADNSFSTVTTLVTATAEFTGANGAQQTRAPPANSRAPPLKLPLCLSSLFAGFAAVLALS